MVSTERYIEKLGAFLGCARRLSELSTCKRAKVGAIIVPCDLSQIYSIGYNGPIMGEPNDSCLDVQGYCGCVHAEANALIKFNADVNKYCILICLTAPCKECAKLIVNSPKIVGVLYDTDYRNKLGIDVIVRASRMIIIAKYSVDCDVVHFAGLMKRRITL